MILLFRNSRSGVEEKMLRGEVNEDLQQMITRLEGDGWEIRSADYTEKTDSRTGGIILEAKV